MRIEIKQVIWLIVFSIAMGFLEAAVVIYLRVHYYPEGFKFPLVLMDLEVAITELLREVATIIMLLGIGMLAGRTKTQRFAFFILAFAIWDIFYYVFLKLILDWPSSLLTWDILFLVPIPWIGPVVTPCIVSLTMIFLAGSLCLREYQNGTVWINLKEWLLLGCGSVVVLLSWTWDYFRFDPGNGLTSAEKSTLFFSTHQPQHFNWWLFGLGEFILLFAVAIFLVRTRGALNQSAHPRAA